MFVIDDPTDKIMESRQAEGIDFIKEDLIPEMVHNRCFCDAGSREFVEFDSVAVEPGKFNGSCEIYRANVVVRFSGEPREFPLVVKLPSNDSETCFDGFQNEEMFYTKMILKYGQEHAPRCYLADLGRYGRPVVVFEDLTAAGYRQLDGKLDEQHSELCVKLLGKFHGIGLKLKANEFSVFREFYAKLLETVFTEETTRYYEERLSRSAVVSGLSARIKKKLGSGPLELARKVVTEINDVSTICHGHFSPGNLLFRYDENGKPIDAKVIDWQTMRYCSPAIDLAGVLSRDTKPQEILSLYVDAVNSKYPEIDGHLLREDIIDKFPFACVIASLRENVADEELVSVLRQLETVNTAD